MLIQNMTVYEDDLLEGFEEVVAGGGGKTLTVTGVAGKILRPLEISGFTDKSEQELYYTSGGVTKWKTRVSGGFYIEFDGRRKCGAGETVAFVLEGSDTKCALGFAAVFS